MRRTVLLLTSLAVLGGAPAAQAACPDADITIGSGNLAKADDALFCLVNEYRVRSGLGELGFDRTLSAAAGAHSRDMVARRFFSHTDPQGRGPGDRARAAGHSGSAGIGENIAYDTEATPRSIFDGFRNSPGHNRNMLGSSYRSAAMGFAAGVPVAGFGGRGATVTQLFSTAEGSGTPNGDNECTRLEEKRAARARALRTLRRDDAKQSKIDAAARKLKRAREALADCRAG